MLPSPFSALGNWHLLTSGHHYWALFWVFCPTCGWCTPHAVSANMFQRKPTELSEGFPNCTPKHHASGFLFCFVTGLFFVFFFNSFCYTLILAMERKKYPASVRLGMWLSWQSALGLICMYAALGSMSRTAQSGRSGAHLHSQHLRDGDTRPA